MVLTSKKDEEGKSKSTDEAERNGEEAPSVNIEGEREIVDRLSRLPSLK